MEIPILSLAITKIFHLIKSAGIGIKELDQNHIVCDNENLLKMYSPSPDEFVSSSEQI